MTTPWADGFAKLNPGKIEQPTGSEDGHRLIGPMSNLRVDLPAEMRFFGEPMVGITVKQFDEYQALRARAAEICTWKHCPEECDGYYETTCGEESVWTTGDINSMKFCPDCGRKVEVKP
jgi:hypothetical protein